MWPALDELLTAPSQKEVFGCRVRAMSEISVSVIIPTHNRVGTLERAIRSVWAQTEIRWELIVVDDGSDDTTSELLSRLQEERSFVWTSQENRGVSAARNRGVSLAQGEWLCFLDSDDEWLPQKLEKQLAYAETNPMCPLVHTDEIWIRRGVRVNPMKKHTKKGGDVFFQALQLCCISPSTTMIRKTAYHSYGGFREDFPVCEDYHLWLHIAAENEVGFIDEPLVTKYGGHKDQLSRRYKAMDYYRVLSIHDVLRCRFLTDDKRRAAIKTLQEKTEILLQGYKKHDNMTHFEEVQNLQQKWV